MTVFNPQNKSRLTYGDCLDPIFKITDKEDAMQYKRSYIAFVEKSLTGGKNASGETAEQIVNSNIGYYAGYGSKEDRKRIESLFECAHPVFGSIADNGAPTGKEAFECGKTGSTLNQVRSV